MHIDTFPTMAANIFYSKKAHFCIFYKHSHQWLLKQEAAFEDIFVTSNSADENFLEFNNIKSSKFELDDNEFDAVDIQAIKNEI